MNLRNVYIAETNCISPLGFDVDNNVDSIRKGITGIQAHNDKDLMPIPFYASIIGDGGLNAAFSTVTQDLSFTKLEKMMILALNKIIDGSGVVLNARCGFILSTTKGNIEALQHHEKNLESARLSQLAKKVADFFGFKTEPIVLSNACVSGVMAVSVAKRLIQSEMFDEVFVVGGDIVSQFVLSGFNSFQAMSDMPCKPYSKNRTGVSIGEAAAAVRVTTEKENAKVQIIGDSSINDANHISGPLRTGEGLFLSVKNALSESGIAPEAIDYISAHGTATPFNDEMEAVAFNRLNLANTPINSLKGYYGHTLGASGLLETVIGIESMTRSQLYRSLGFDEIGVSEPLNVIRANQNKTVQYFLKTASGFGGCNTAAIFEKVN